MKEITLGEFLDLIDKSRESEEFVRIMGHNGYYVMRAMVAFPDWGDLEQRTVDSIGIECGEYQIWLKD